MLYFLLGSCQFQVKILQKAGYRVVVITEKALHAVGSTPGQHLQYIYDKLKTQQASEYLSDEDWGGLELNDNDISITDSSKVSCLV